MTQDPGQQQVHQHEHQERKRQRHGGPLQERHRDPNMLFQQACHGHVGGRADQRRDAAKVCGVGRSEKQGNREARVLVEVDFGHDRQRNGQHHERRGGVRNPHTQGGRRHHETRQQAAGPTTCRHQNAQRKSAVQVPPFEGEGNQEPAHEQEDKLRTVRRRRLRDVRHAKEREKRKRQHRSDPKRHRLNHPPDQHPRCSGEHADHALGEACGRARGPREERCGRPEDDAK